MNRSKEPDHNELDPTIILKRTIVERDDEISRLNARLQSSTGRIRELEEEIANMRKSVVWRMLMKYHNSFVEPLMPPGSRQRNLYDQFLNECRDLAKKDQKSLMQRQNAPTSSYNNPREVNTEIIDRSAYLEKYGSDFSFDIDERDEMFQFLVNHIKVKDPISQYLLSGEIMLPSLDKVFSDAGIGFDKIDSFLDFACGYGRFARFLVQKCDKNKITISDIDKDAVDFCKKTFKVKGFYSASDPGALEHKDKYDVIFVASLFSHLALPLWKSWLKKLYGMLNRGGILIISTHGDNCLAAVDGETRKRIETIENGFCYLGQSETLRLPVDEYGTVYVTRDFVESFVRQNKLGKVMGFYPKELWNFQDIYAIKKI